VISGEYNPVAYVILKAAVEYPARYGERLVGDVEQYGKIILRDLREKVKEYYPPHPSGQPSGYIWVRYFRCPECGCEVPSLMSLQLDRVKGYAFYPEVKGNRTELRVVKVEELEKIKVGNKNEVRVRVTEGRLKGTVFDTPGYVNRGVLECPAHRHTIPEGEVKRQYREQLEKRAKQGYHGSHPARLAAIVFKEGDYAEPTPEIVKVYENAEEHLKDK
jgi:putative DNA methylase